MFKKSSIVFGALIITMAGLANQVSAECLTVHGKAANNMQQNGNTQGVASLRLDTQKLKCAIVGVPQSVIPGGPNFLHNIVCDNKASFDEAQSQVTLKTWFTSPPNPTGLCAENNPYGEVSFSFEEVSFPDPNSVRGDFMGITDGGSIIIKGDYNCDGGIIMKFSGEFCFSE